MQIYPLSFTKIKHDICSFFLFVTELGVRSEIEMGSVSSEWEITTPMSKQSTFDWGNVQGNVIDMSEQLCFRTKFHVGHSGRLPWSSPANALRQILSPLVKKQNRRAQVLKHRLINLKKLMKSRVELSFLL